MYLALAATTLEMQAFECAAPHLSCQKLVSGVGILETTLSLSRFLAMNTSAIQGVINFGIGGAYVDNCSGHTVGLLDVCLAEREVLGDLGVCFTDHIETLELDTPSLQQCFSLDSSLIQQGGDALSAAGIAHETGTFVTVQCVSGTEKRGDLLAESWQALCENMEGAAVVRVCEEFSLSCLEVRCMSNLVEDRNPSNWKIRQACDIAGKVAGVIIGDLESRRDHTNSTQQ